MNKIIATVLIIGLSACAAPSTPALEGGAESGSIPASNSNLSRRATGNQYVYAGCGVFPPGDIFNHDVTGYANDPKTARQFRCAGLRVSILCRPNARAPIIPVKRVATANRYVRSSPNTCHVALPRACPVALSAHFVGGVPKSHGSRRREGYPVPFVCRFGGCRVPSEIVFSSVFE
jgi:hypothetical protein